MTVEYRAYLVHKKEGPPVWADDILAHYGIKGQKWGVRNYQYAEGGYTPAGAERYWGGTGQGRRRTAQQWAYTGARRSGSASIARSTSTIRSTNRANTKRPLTDEQRAARRAKARKAIAIGAGIAVAAALGYAAYKGSTNLRDQMRSDIRNNMKVTANTFNNGNFKYWDTADKDRYAKLTKEHTDYLVKNTTRRDAIAAKFAQKTGIRVNLPKSRAKAVEARHEGNTYANFLRGANNRANLNKQISEAKASVRRAEELASRAAQERSNIQNGRYGEHMDELWQKQIEAQRERLNDLLNQKRSM